MKLLSSYRYKASFPLLALLILVHLYKSFRISSNLAILSELKLGIFRARIISIKRQHCHKDQNFIKKPAYAGFINRLVTRTLELHRKTCTKVSTCYIIRFRNCIDTSRTVSRTLVRYWWLLIE